MTKLNKNLFDLSHDVKLSCNMGELIPVMALECIPGDKHTISAESLIRFAPLTAPVMHRFDVSLHYFFVPNRIIWTSWENYITNTPYETTGELPVPPFITMKADNSNHQIGSLADYLGVPYVLPGITPTAELNVSALPFAAYQCIYNEYYRDQNLIDEILYKVADGDNSFNPELIEKRTRAWEHDYFTACLPWAQKGEAVDIPLGNVALNTDNYDNWEMPTWDVVDGAIPTPAILGGDNIIKSGSGESFRELPDGSNENVVYDPKNTLTVQPTTINDLRRAFRLQEWLEKAARGGSRYIEWIKVMFGVTSSDARLQRPEYITGTKTPVVISEVLNTSGNSDMDLPQGNMSGHGVSVTSGGGSSYYCEEHGWIIGIMSVLPKPAYFQGIDRSFTKLSDPTEYYFSSFANIGEQEVKNKEIFAFDSQQEETFGYIPRYSEYRFMPNRVAGEFRTSLEFWHEARKFDNPPQLNKEFIECLPSHRIFAVEDPTVQKLYCQVYNRVMSIRPIPKYGTPTF